MISFTSGEKVAVVCGGQYDKTKIYIKTEEEKPERKVKKDDDVFEYLDDDDFNMNRFKKFPVKDRLKLAKALRQNTEPLDEYLVEKYNGMSKKLNNRLKKEFE